MQDHLAAQVEADLHRFLVFVRGLVHVVVALRLEEEVSDLADAHRERPPKQGGDDWMREQQDVRDQETARADQVKRLVDAAVMIEAMVIPALLLELLEESGHGPSLESDRTTGLFERAHSHVSSWSRLSRDV